jgi:hypothetical protein
MVDCRLAISRGAAGMNAHSSASWFETHRFAMLLTMRV